MKKTSFYLYQLIILCFYIAGFVYLTRQSFMPYHSEILGLPWPQLDASLQVLILAGIHGFGGFLVCIASALMFLLYIPFKTQQFWAKIAVALITFLTLAVLIGVVVSVKIQTAAHPPFIPLLVLLFFWAVATVLSFTQSVK